MKYIVPLVMTLFLYACSGSNNNEGGDADQSVVTNFLEDVSSFEDFEHKTPIAAFAEMADDLAFKSKSFDKDNAAEVLSEARAYKHVVLIVEDHTIVKIVDLADCNQSGSWGVCMPRAEGYIKKGDLVDQDDYLNNIIGRPDDQERTVYLFN